MPQILAGRRRGRATLFVTVLNVHDHRKQLRPMLEGFVAFSQTHPDAVLLVKASTPHRGVSINHVLLHEQIAEPGAHPRMLVSDRVWITDDVLTRTEMEQLYDAGAFYLCTSHAEGQNLPLLEAMARGAVPVSVDHTAMADYIRPDNAVPIRSTRQPFGMRLSRRYGMTGLATHFVEAADVRMALAEAAALGEADYAARSAAACATVRNDYGTARLETVLHDLIARIAPVTALA
ncbi:glycosyltransferase [Sphingomonas solaris]|uniref:Glycosyltransferase n=1 Tax=Alterirhizorhabdus solaris TaxID=2529389 RepID=A0A558QUC5_9SPHN|nr:glycosyltransferase [Sphingomonas solaris]TVV70743.1 glycosyltransferase [Sphingomonas solaris]